MRLGDSKLGKSISLLILLFPWKWDSQLRPLQSMYRSFSSCDGIMSQKIHCKLKMSLNTPKFTYYWTYWTSELSLALNLLNTLTLAYSWAKSSLTKPISKCWISHVISWILGWRWKTEWLCLCPSSLWWHDWLGAVVQPLPSPRASHAVWGKDQTWKFKIWFLPS